MDYNKEGHPRTRLSEKQLDEQMLALFETLRVEREEVRDWFVTAVLKLMEAVGVHSDGLHLFQLRRRNCNQIKGLAKFDGQLAVAPS